MFESAELGHTIGKTVYDRKVPKLRAALLEAQLEIAAKKACPLVILIGGVDGAGKGETVNLLNEWMDPRHIQTHAMGAPTDEERERPPMWRFWRALPPKGKIGIFFGSWYTAPIVSRVYGETKSAELESSLDEIVRFERMLTDEGALILKFWFHLSKKAQKKRLKALEADPKTRWRVANNEWKRFKLYDQFRTVSESALRQTSTDYAPWIVLDEIVRFERMLTDEGALILKFWFHLSKKAQKKRLKALEADPKTRWRVANNEWKRFKLYDQFRTVSESALRQTSTDYAPWIVVD